MAGGLEGWKIRHAIRVYKRHEESGDVDLRVVDGNISGMYLLSNTYNMNETAFFY